MLRDLLFVLKETPVCIFGTYRNDEMPHLFEQLPQMRQIILERLSADEVAELSQAMIGEAGRQSNVLEFVTRETEGNPFFLVEVMRALAMDAGRLLLVGSKTLPEQVFTGGIQQIVRQRIQQVPEWGQHFVQIAAAAGRLLDLTILEQILQSQPDSMIMPLDMWLTTCADVHVLNISNQRWQFSHDKIRDQIIRDTEPEMLPQFHTLIATAIEACYPNDPARVEILMNHWHMAGNNDKELLYLNLALERLVWYRGEYQQAQALARHGLSLLPAGDARRINLLNHLSEAYWRMGDFEEGRRYALKANHLGKQANVPQDRARSLGNLGIIARMQRQDDKAQKYFLQSLKLRRDLNDTVGIARSYANLGILAFSQGKLDNARRFYLRSLKLQRQISDENGIILNLLNLGEILSSEGNHDEAQKYIRRCLRIARKIGNRYAIAASLNTLGVAAFLKSEDEVAGNYLRQGLEAFQSIHNQYGTLHTLAYLVNVLPIDDPQLRLWLAEGLHLAQTMEQEYFALYLLVGGAGWYAGQQRMAKAYSVIEAVKKDKSFDSNMQFFIDHFGKRISEGLVQATNGTPQMFDWNIDQALTEILTDLVS